MTDTTLGQRIAEGRKKLGLSQEAFGDRLGVSRQAASKWESDAAVPEIDKLITMSKLFGVSIGWLLGVEDPEAPAEATLSEEQLSAVTELLCRYPTPCPERKSRKWLIAACAAGLAVNLALGCAGLFLPKYNVPPLADSSTLQSQIDNLTDHNTQLQQQVEDLNTQLGLATDEQALSHAALQAFQQEVEQLKQQLEQDAPSPDNGSNDNSNFPEQVHPANDLLDSWSLSPKLDPSKESTTLRFSGFTETEAAEARLIAILGGYEMASAICQRNAVGYAGELELPRVDGYTYFFELTYADGTRQQTELTGHGLSDLSFSTEPTLSLTSEDHLRVSTGKKYFWLTKPVLSLSVPRSLYTNTPCAWTKLRLVYYCNGEAVEEQDLSKNLGGLPQFSHQLDFELYNIIFAKADTAEGSTHNVRLEGTLTVNGLDQTFSLEIGDWVMRSGKLVDASE